MFQRDIKVLPALRAATLHCAEQARSTAWPPKDVLAWAQAASTFAHAHNYLITFGGFPNE